MSRVRDWKWLLTNRCTNTCRATRLLDALVSNPIYPHRCPVPAPMQQLDMFSPGALRAWRDPKVERPP